MQVVLCENAAMAMMISILNLTVQPNVKAMADVNTDCDGDAKYKGN